MAMIGEIIADDLEIANTDNEICTIGALLQGTEALVMLFTPYCFGDVNLNSMEKLLMDVNQNLEDFNQQDLRVICITREPPSTIRHWISDKDIKLDIFSDPSLDVSSSLVGTFDLSLYTLASNGANIGTFFVSMPAVLIVSGDGRIISKYVASSPETVQISSDDIIRMCGITF